MHPPLAAALYNAVRSTHILDSATGHKLCDFTAINQINIIRTYSRHLYHLGFETYVYHKIMLFEILKRNFNPKSLFLEKISFGLKPARLFDVLWTTRHAIYWAFTFTSLNFYVKILNGFLCALYLAMFVYKFSGFL